MNHSYKKLKRSVSNHKICGVCGGIGEYLNIDPTVVRILWIIVAFTSLGMAVLAYFIVAVVMPDEDDIVDEPDDSSRQE